MNRMYARGNGRRYHTMHRMMRCNGISAALLFYPPKNVWCMTWSIPPRFRMNGMNIFLFQHSRSFHICYDMVFNLNDIFCCFVHTQMTNPKTELFLRIIFLAGVGVGWQCLQGLEGETYHTTSFAIGHPWWRGVGQSDQGNHCRWWCHPAHPQIAYRQKERPRVTVLSQYSPNMKLFFFLYIYKLHFI